MGSAGYVSWFADIGLKDRPHVGGKGGSLGELQRAGIAVPPGFVVRTEAFEIFLQVLEREADRKSTRLNSSHVEISYAVFCLNKKKTNNKVKLYMYYHHNDLV